MNRFLVAAIDGWHRELFEKNSVLLTGHWDFVSTPDELQSYLSSNCPKYIFFPHWRWIVPAEIVKEYHCICFHMTDLPYGRGGSPLQNLILRGHKKTVLTVLRMDQGIDTGPVYFKEPLSLDGSAEEIYLRAAVLTWKMIERLVKEDPKPVFQAGETVLFKRRSPVDSELPEFDTLQEIYDFIRMLDAPGYPHAFLNTKKYILKFTQANLSNKVLSAKVTIRLEKDDHE